MIRRAFLKALIASPLGLLFRKTRGGRFDRDVAMEIHRTHAHQATLGTWNTDGYEYVHKEICYSSPHNTTVWCYVYNRGNHSWDYVNDFVVKHGSR